MTLAHIPSPEGLADAGPSPEPRPLRLLIAPFADSSYPHEGQWHAGMRWVTELNGHPGECSPDHRHCSPEAALACFRGER